MRIEYVRLPNGKVPMDEFVDGLNPKAKSKVIEAMAMLRSFGSQLREPYSKPIGKGLFELRARSTGLQARCLFFFFDGETAVLTHGFIKKTQKTPRAEIERAERYKELYLSYRSERMGDEDGRS